MTEPAHEPPAQTPPARRPRGLLLPLAVLAGLMLAGVLGLGAMVRSSGPTDFAGDPVALTAYKGGQVTGVPAQLAGASLVARGEYLVRAADCAPCHTAPGRPEFAGGRAFKLPFGTIYSSNLTSDRTHGIGAWSDAEFVAAVKHGTGRGGERLYPAMPYPTFRQITDDDAKAMRAYLATLAPVAAAPPANDLSFPFSQRGLMSVWNALFARDADFAPVAGRSAQWNRGAYLAEALGHCSECHTPRGAGMWLKQNRKFAGAETNGWYAHNLTPDKASGIGEWSDAQLDAYLSTGLSGGKGVASGPMGEAVDHGTRHLVPEDRAALIAYLRSVPAIATGPARVSKAAGKGFAHSFDASLGERTFAANCAGCHAWGEGNPYAADASLGGLSSLNDGSGVNIVQVILQGSGRKAPATGAMPAFGAALSDEEVAATASYVARRFGRPVDIDIADVRRLRALGH